MDCQYLYLCDDQRGVVALVLIGCLGVVSAAWSGRSSSPRFYYGVAYIAVLMLGCCTLWRVGHASEDWLITGLCLGLTTTGSIMAAGSIETNQQTHRC